MEPDLDDSPAGCSFIGGSDGRIIMDGDEAALVRLWREKRGEADAPDYSDNLLVQAEPLNRFERTTGEVIPRPTARSSITGPNIFAGLLTGAALALFRQAVVAPQIGRVGQADASPRPQLRQSAPAARARSASGFCR
jgi:hypothetical protein